MRTRSGTGLSAAAFSRGIGSPLEPASIAKARKCSQPRS
jgi:hypothetical protein